MVQDLLHRQIVRRLPQVQDWFQSLRVDLDIPVYSSYDIREAEFKVTNVDANIYPAGFNNICATDREHAGELFQRYLSQHYGPSFKKILVLSEEHTQNPYYWDNVRALVQIIADAGCEVQVAFPRSRDRKSVV